MAASMPCRDCATGTLHEGTPKGRVETVHGLPTYIAEPPSGTPKGIIVIIPDAFGWELPNSRVLADSYAEKGNFRVYLPDFMDGHWIEHDLLKSLNQVTSPAPSYFGAVMKFFPGLRSFAGFAPFLFFNRLSISKPRVYKFFHDLRSAEASLPIGVAGFCWGGKFVTLLCADSEKAANGRSLVDAGFTAHPSMLDVPADIEAVTLPLSVCIGDVDFGLPIAGVRQIQEIFGRKNGSVAVGGRYEIVVLEGAKHGFAVRGNPKVKKEMEQGMVAEDQAVNWFRKWCT